MSWTGAPRYAASGRSMSPRDPNGMSPLHYVPSVGVLFFFFSPPASPPRARAQAAQEGRADVCKVLVDCGADANAKTNLTHIVPLWLAAYHGHRDCVAVLAARGRGAASFFGSSFFLPVSGPRALPRPRRHRFPGVKVNPKCVPERAGILPGPLKGSLSASAAARQEKHYDVADFIDARAGAA